MDDVKKISKKKITLIFLLYFFFAIIYTFPLIFLINTDLIGSGGIDGFQYIWNLFSFWYQIVHLQTPFYNQLIFYPVGANLLFSDYSPLTSLIGLPFLNASILFMNLIMLIGPTISASATFLLVYKITKRISASILAGFIYGFSPTIGAFIETQHNYYLLASIFLPVIFLLILNFFHKPQRYIKRLIITFLLLFFTNYYYFILAGLLSAVFVIAIMVTDKERRTKVFAKEQYNYYLNSLQFLAIISLFMFALFYQHSNQFSGISNKENLYAANCNANIVGFFTPASQNISFQDLSNRLHTIYNFPENGDTPFYYLGMLFFSAAAITIILYSKEKNILPYIITLIVATFLSLGLTIRFGDTELLTGSVTPFYYFTKFPLLNMIDCPIRFTGAIHLFIAILSAILISKVLTKNTIIGILLLIAGFISIPTDYYVGNFSFTDVYVPRVYYQLKSFNDQKTILELPSGLTESKGAYGYDWPSPGLHTRQLYWQTIHQKPRIGGYISRIPETTYQYFKTKPIISDFFNLTSLDGKWSYPHYTSEQKEKFIKDFNLGYIIIEPEERQEEFALATEQILEGIPYQKTTVDNYLLYKINLESK